MLLLSALHAPGPYGFIGHQWEGTCNSDYTLPSAFLGDYGTPLGNCSTGDNVTWSRRWSKVTVTIDCSDLTATITPVAS